MNISQKAKGIDPSLVVIAGCLFLAGVIFPFLARYESDRGAVQSFLKGFFAKKNIDA